LPPRIDSQSHAMTDHEFCNRSATLAAEIVREEFPDLERGAADYSAFGPGIILFFGNDGRGTDEISSIVPRLREFLAIEEVGLRELGFGTTADRRTWAMLVEGRRDADYCRRLIGKAHREVRAAKDALG
jgi:hypothetical protein